MVDSKLTVERQFGRARINQALAGLDILGMAEGNVKPSELAAAIPDAEVAGTLAFARAAVEKVFPQPDDGPNRRYWTEVAANLSDRLIR